MRLISYKVYPAYCFSSSKNHIYLDLSSVSYTWCALFHFNVFILLIFLRFFDISRHKDIKVLSNWSAENQLMSKLNYHLHLHLYHLKPEPSVKGMWGPCLRIIAKMPLLN